MRSPSMRSACRVRADPAYMVAARAVYYRLDVPVTLVYGLEHPDRVAEPSSMRGDRLSGRLGLAQASEPPEEEEGPEPERSREGRDDLWRRTGDEPARGLDHACQRIDDRHAVDPTLEQRQRHIHRSEEEDEEHRHLHRRARLHRP